MADEDVVGAGCLFDCFGTFLVPSRGDLPRPLYLFMYVNLVDIDFHWCIQLSAWRLTSCCQTRNRSL